MAKPRRFGLAERVGWLRRTDVDSELWPEDTFGGVSDEQFWDDIAADKPLATTARTAQQDNRTRRRPRPPADRTSVLPAQPPPAQQPAPAAPAAAIQQPAQFPLTQSPLTQAPRPAGPPPARITTGPQPLSPTRPVQPGHTVPAHSTPAHGVPAHSTQAYAVQPPGRGRPGPDEDPLTSAAYSLRSNGAVDSRSYQASRRARELTREQYEAALTQETQAFTLADADAAGGGYPGGASPPRQPGGHRPNGHRPDTRDGYDGYGPTAAYPYAQTSDSERSGYPAGSGSRPPRSRGPRGPERR